MEILAKNWLVATITRIFPEKAIDFTPARTEIDGERTDLIERLGWGDLSHRKWGIFKMVSPGKEWRFRQ